MLAELNTWFEPILIAGALAFELVALGLGIAIARSGVLGRRTARCVIVALAVTASVRFVPLGAARYVGGAAGLAALWPLAWTMWRIAGSGAPASPSRAPLTVGVGAKP